MKTRHIFGLASILGLSILLSACYYDEVIPKPVESITQDVSFSNDIIPIFNANCNVSGCHNLGGINPDLTPANAFNQLDSQGFIDRANPENSPIYQWMQGNGSLTMPPSGIDPGNNALVLAWIKQGAKNN